MTTWPQNSHHISSDGQGYLAYRRHAGVAIALGDPVGPAGAAQTIVKEFIRLCDHASLVPCLFSTGGGAAAITDRLGWLGTQVAEDNLLDLPDLEFKGKAWQDVRTALNRASKQGIEFRLVTLADQRWALVRQVEELSEEWLGDKGLPEMGFTLGGVTEALDPATRVGLAVDQAGLVHGVTSWLPIYAGGGVITGWTLDLMRRRDGGFKSVMEFLIASSCTAFRDEGAAVVSLSGAPLARSARPAADTAIGRLMDSLGAALEPVYGFRSLSAFKSKFQPRREPLYLTYRDEADLPRIGIALTRAYLPATPVTQLLAVARHH